MGEQNWSLRDLTGIKPRRPEGEGECVDECDQMPLYLMWPQLGNSGGVRKHLQREPQFGDGSNMPMKVNSMMTDQRQPSDGLKEFEFNMSATPSERACPVVMSSADELFFKGQLLPLHPPPRLRMVQRLASEKQQLVSDSNHPLVQTPQPRVRRLGFLPKYSKFWVHNPDLLSSSSNGTLPDCGIARFRGHSWSDPEERDSSTDSCRDSTSGRDSSSSRDSSGSSQDASFPDSSCKDFQMPTSTDLKGSSLHNREVFGTHMRSPAERSVISSWLRPAFKWKSLFGAKKVATRSGAALVDQKPGQRQSVSHISEESTSYNMLDAKCSDALCGKYFGNYSGDISLQGGNKEIPSRDSSFERASIASSDADKDNGGMVKAREYLQKYMKILKPLHLKKYDQHDLDQESCRTGSFSLPSSSLAHESRRQSRSISGNRSFSSLSQSSRFASTGVSPRLQPAALRTPCAARGSGGRQLSNGSISELHSAIQGAIAHCKESQSAAKNEHAAYRSQQFASSMAVRRRTESNLYT
jgi:hypothetical protein